MAKHLNFFKRFFWKHWFKITLTGVTLFWLDSLILIKSAKTMSGVFMRIFTAQIYMELVMTWPDPTPLKSTVPTLKCWTQLVHNILIRLKQALLQNTEIWTLFNLLRVIIKKFKHCFVNFAFISCPLKLCILRDHEKKKLSGKVTQTLLSLKLY